MGKEHQPFEYSERLDDQSIRLIKLYPGKGKQKLKCELNVVLLDAAADTYDALSYVWGSATKDASIICNGRRLPVTTSLKDALRRLRHPTEIKLLWADAVCINQDDLEEKSRQVPLMGSIYQNAGSVPIWLGHDPERIAGDCFNLIKETNRSLAEAWEKTGSVYAPCDLCDDPNRWARLQRLASLPWFRRLWVIQEAGLAKECVLIWGHKEMPFAEYIELVVFTLSRPELPSARKLGSSAAATNSVFMAVHCRYDNTKTWRNDRPLIAASYKGQQKCATVFSNLLNAARRMDATDPRDYIYAFLSNPLAQKTDGSLIVEPDYTKSVDDVFLDTACALLEHPREGPWVLSCVMHRELADIERSDLPSWVPRWDQKLTSSMFSDPTTWFRTGGPASQFQCKVNGRYLTMSGLIADTITWTSLDIRQQDLRLSSNSWRVEFWFLRKSFLDYLSEQAIEASGCSADQLNEILSRVLGRGYPFATPVREDPMRYFTAYQKELRRAAESIDPGSVQVAEPNPSAIGNADANLFLAGIFECHGLRLAHTQGGQFGLVPFFARAGDSCAVFLGVSVPFILRRATGGRYRLVGECYIDAIMSGEALWGGLQHLSNVIIE